MVSTIDAADVINFFTLCKKKEIYISVTDKCFFSCSHCFVTKNNNYLTIKEIKKILNFAYKHKYEINFGGGEIFSLGKKYLKQLIDLFRTDKKYSLYSTLHVSLDDEYVTMLNKFNKITISIDSYRFSIPHYNINLVINNIKKLSNPEIYVSYTPFLNDNYETCEKFYLIAVEIGAKVFHIGFLYPLKDFKLLPPRKYLELIDIFYNLYDKYSGPQIGYFSSDVLKPTENFGFRAYECFRSGLYILPTKKVTSCVIFHLIDNIKIKNPMINLDDFLKNYEKFYNKNLEFIKKEFFDNLNYKCLSCKYYPYCMGGCPYFKQFSQDGTDIYCEVYKKIFEIFINRKF